MRVSNGAVLRRRSAYGRQLVGFVDYRSRMSRMGYLHHAAYGWMCWALCHHQFPSILVIYLVEEGTYGRQRGPIECPTSSCVSDGPPLRTVRRARTAAVRATAVIDAAFRLLFHPCPRVSHGSSPRVSTCRAGTGRALVRWLT